MTIRAFERKQAEQIVAGILDNPLNKAEMENRLTSQLAIFAYDLSTLKIKNFSNSLAQLLECLEKETDAEKKAELEKRIKKIRTEMNQTSAIQSQNRSENRFKMLCEFLTARGMQKLLDEFRETPEFKSTES